jgi:hypothetical protein
MTLTINDTQHNNLCQYAERHLLFIVLLNVIMLGVIILDVAVLSVISV